MQRGGWEGNWLAYNDAQDVRLPGSAQASVPSLTHPPKSENAQGMLDSLDAENVRHPIKSVRLLKL